MYILYQDELIIQLENRPPRAAQFPLHPSLRWSSDHTHRHQLKTVEVPPADTHCLPPS